MKKILLMGLVWFSWNAAGDSVCVRNYLAVGLNPCEPFPESWVYVTENETGRVLCTQHYTEAYCDLTPEFQWAVSRAGDRVCVLDYGQEAGNMCSEAPENYGYIPKATR